jgi:hypothetical protein
MYDNIQAHGVASQLALYKAPGRAVIQTYVDDVAAGVTDQTTIVNDMEAEIEAQGPYNVSHHCATSAEWAELQVLDIAPSSLSNGALFAYYGSQDLADGFLSAFITPQKKDPAYHLEIPQ